MNLKTDDLHDKAAFWFTRFESGQITNEQRKAFEIWINENPAHLAAFEEIEALSANMKAISKNHRQHNPDKTTEFGAAVIETAALVRAHRIHKEGYTIRRKLAAVAATILILMSGVWFWQSPASKYGVTSYQTAIGEQKMIMLSDGSVMTLNTNSEISVAMTDNIRRLHLMRGEVFFKVAKDKSRPFEVAVQNAFVRAVGTAFNIRQRGAQVSVLVAEGTVEVKSSFTPLAIAQDKESLSEKKELLMAGDQITFGREKLQRVQLESELVSRTLLWREGRLILDEKSLAEIIREIQPYIVEKIIIADDGVAQLVAGGVFRLGEVNSFFDALEVALPVKIVREKDVIILARRQQKNLI